MIATNGTHSRLLIKDLENNLVRDPSFRVMPDRKEVLRYRNHYRGTDKRVGFVGGVYDRLSDGHIKYLLKCLSMCEILIVALDNDELARKRKNDPLRPWDHEQKRARILSWGGLAHIITFRHADEHPYDLIRLLEPDVLFTSSSTRDVTDEDRQRLEEFCGEVMVFEPQSPEHTTDEFLRFEAFHTSNAAAKIIAAVNDMVIPFGKKAMLIDTEDGKNG